MDGVLGGRYCDECVGASGLEGLVAVVPCTAKDDESYEQAVNILPGEMKVIRGEMERRPTVAILLSSFLGGDLALEGR